jgi:methyl-CpG-binding domain protein 4
LTAEPYFWEVLKRWKSPEQLAIANELELITLIQPLGLSQRRAKALKQMSYEYTHKDWKGDATKLYGIGKYGSDAYRIFCKGEWRDVQPKDGALVNYHNYLKTIYGETDA